jgi:hypothetical protein
LSFIWKDKKEQQNEFSEKRLQFDQTKQSNEVRVNSSEIFFPKSLKEKLSIELRRERIEMMSRFE